MTIRKTLYALMAGMVAGIINAIFSYFCMDSIDHAFFFYLCIFHINFGVAIQLVKRWTGLRRTYNILHLNGASILLYMSTNLLESRVLFVGVVVLTYAIVVGYLYYFYQKRLDKSASGLDIAIR
ncbi:hypothetical protein K4L44_17465 [Halosquirtibacter laminarini]|uniref:Uncharacterized protein n=1 Tax=Halosquirtibacter laminarini TaxID=3374600 RepID=A0AC61NF94_9BACT|nr:hypothetical protein K4L44_17465 [Prolixibacteraceae bacterium]